LPSFWVLLLWHIIFNLFGLYRSMRFSSRWVEIGNVLKATSWGTLMMLCVAFLLRMEVITSVFVGVFWGVSNATSLLGRFSMRFLLAQMRRYGRNLRFMLIVGTNERAMRFANVLNQEGTVSNHWLCR
jgi:FlaA1/EpsC-like NDP-sugar epimerase